MTGAGSGTTCSGAQSQASSNRNSEAMSNYTRYCNCKTVQKRWSASVNTDITCNSHESIIYAGGYSGSYNNPCGTSKSITVTATDGYSTLASKTVTVPTGSGSLRGSLNWSKGSQCGNVTIGGDGSGNC